MCEYCGCQSLESLAELTREHDQVVDLIGDVRDEYGRGDLGRMLALAQRISAVLGPHTAVEEQALFPAMAPDFPEKIAILEAEHRRIESVLAGADDGTGRSDPDWPARLIDALALLREHIFKEQDGVFPAALSTLTTAEWQHLDQVRVVENARATIHPILPTTSGSGKPVPAGVDRAAISAERPICP